jgi:GNAT superfamily N-acetyltransferase
MERSLIAIKPLSSSPFRESIISIYESSFPSNQTRPTEKVIRMVDHSKNYRLFVSLSNGEVIGILLIYLFSSLRIGLLDYMAVVPNCQGKGIGTELFNHTLKKFTENV